MVIRPNPEGPRGNGGMEYDRGRAYAILINERGVLNNTYSA